MYMYIYTSVCLYIHTYTRLYIRIFFPHILYHSATCLFKLSRSCKSFHVKTQRSIGLAKKLVRYFCKMVWKNPNELLANPILYSLTAMVCLIL